LLIATTEKNNVIKQQIKNAGSSKKYCKRSTNKIISSITDFHSLSNSSVQLHDNAVAIQKIQRRDHVGMIKAENNIVDELDRTGEFSSSRQEENS